MPAGRARETKAAAGGAGRPEWSDHRLSPTLPGQGPPRSRPRRSNNAAERSSRNRRTLGRHDHHSSTSTSCSPARPGPRLGEDDESDASSLGASFLEPEIEDLPGVHHQRLRASRRFEAGGRRTSWATTLELHVEELPGRTTSGWGRDQCHVRQSTVATSSSRVLVRRRMSGGDRSSPLRLRPASGFQHAWSGPRSRMEWLMTWSESRYRQILSRPAMAVRCRSPPKPVAPLPHHRFKSFG